MTLRTRFLGYVVCFVLFLLLPKSAYAAESLVISEVYANVASNKGSDPADEWVELYNQGATPINLKNWTLADTTTNHTIITTDYMISSHQFVLIAKDSSTFSRWGIDPLDPANDFITIATGTPIGGGLNNSGDRLVLADSTGIPIDQISYGSNRSIFMVDVGPKGSSLERINVDTDTDTANDFQIEPLPSPGYRYTPIIYPDVIHITEILPHPSDGSAQEYIKLMNDSDFQVNLTGWVLDDREGGSTPYAIPTGITIGAHEPLTFYNSETHLALNDTGDDVRLFDPRGILKQSISYDSAPRNSKFLLTREQWQWDTSIAISKSAPSTSPHPVNDYDIIHDPPLSITLARTLPDNTLVKIQGTITTTPGQLSPTTITVQDHSAGIDIFYDDLLLPPLTSAMEIQVTGILSSFAQNRRIKLSSANGLIIIKDKCALPVRLLAPEMVDESAEGQLITTEGPVTETSGDTFFVGIDQPVKVLIREITGINKPPMRVGDRVQVTGIVSQYRSEYRVLPFLDSHVTIIASTRARSRKSIPALPATGANYQSRIFIFNCILWTFIAAVNKIHQRLLAISPPN